MGRHWARCRTLRSMLEAWILLPPAQSGIGEGTRTAAPSNLPWMGPLGTPDRARGSRRANGLVAPIEVASSLEGPCFPGPGAGSYNGQNRGNTNREGHGDAKDLRRQENERLLAEQDQEQYWYPRDRDRGRRSLDQDRLRETYGEGRLNSSRCQSLGGAGERRALCGASSRRSAAGAATSFWATGKCESAELELNRDQLR
ncbi:hypothetical protein UY3_07104 [Chelonia mydas]|uniref:Uncharacterized protein n=1 Tax=Chelonia mydas TaxID=8469 RepID=M7BEW7_CHEMY|nr:hypothetical protein UY3_07104 [Chelonia mydas]